MSRGSSLPTKLGDVIPAPEVSYSGNHLYKNWTASFPAYNFTVDGLKAELLVADYQPIQAWPRLYDFLGDIAEATEKSTKPQAAIRAIATSAGTGFSGDGIMNVLSDTIMDCKGLMAVTIVGLALSLIIVPIAACVTYCVLKKRYRSDYRYDPYSTTDSLATAYYDQTTTKQRYNNMASSPSSLTYNGSNVSNFGTETKQSMAQYSPGLVAMAILAIIMAVFAAFGIGGSFYFNDSFSFSLNRSSIIVEAAMIDVQSIINQFTGEFGVVATTIQDDIKAKIGFAEKAMDGFGAVFSDTTAILDLAQKSNAIWLLLLLVTWENSATFPIRDSLSDTATALQNLNDLEARIMALNGSINFADTVAQLCPAYRDASACRSNNNANINSNVCNTCLLPVFPQSVDPFSFRQTSYQRVQLVLDSLTKQMEDINSVKLGQIGLSRDQLMGQVTTLKDSLTNDLTSFIDHYKNWYEGYVKPVMDGSDCMAASTTRTTKPTTKPTMPPSTVSTLPTTTKSTTSTSTTSTTTTTTEPPPSATDVAVNAIREAFNDRHYVTLALLILATIQLAAMIAGAGCMLFVYFTSGSNRARVLRAREPFLVDKIGRYLIIGSSVVYVAFTGPLLCILGAAHFYSGSFINKSICNMIRQQDFEAFDKMLNGENGNNIVTSFLPVCINRLIASIDPDLIKRVTVGKFLTAARNGETLNEFVRLDDTVFLRDVKKLKYLQLNTHLTVYNDQVDIYMKKVSEVATSHGFFQLLIDSFDKNDLAQLNATIKGCSKCVLNSVATTANMNPSASTELKNSTNTTKQYQLAVSQYLDALPGIISSLGDTSDVLQGALEKSASMTSMMRSVENFFLAIISLIKSELIYLVSLLLALIFKGVTEDIGHLDGLFTFYDAIVRQYGCVELIGAMNAFWFFVGIYLTFSTVSALLLIATYAILVGLRRDGLGSKHWESRTPLRKSNTASMAMMEPVGTVAAAVNSDTVNSFARLQSLYRSGISNSNKAFLGENENYSMTTFNTAGNSNRVSSRSSFPAYQAYNHLAFEGDEGGAAVGASSSSEDHQPVEFKNSVSESTLSGDDSSSDNNRNESSAASQKTSTFRR